MTTVSALDWFVVAASFTVTLGTGLWMTARGKQSSSASDYFIGARSMTWQLVGASMFASNIGTEHFVGQAGSAAAGGLAVGLYEWLSVYNILMLAYLFAPLYRRLELTTVSQYVAERFDARLRTALTFICLLGYVTTKISATLITGVFLVQVIYGDEVNIYLVSSILVLVTACYTVAGGLKVVMITDAIQMGIFLVGGFLGLWVTLSRVGFHEMKTLLPPEFFHVVRHEGEYEWTAMFVGQPITSCWYWCIDQFIAQRVLAARTLAHGQSGCLMAGFLKFLPPFMLCFPGMAARALYEQCKKGEIGHPLVDAAKLLVNYPNGNPWCNTRLDEPHQANMAYPLLVVHEFPAGLKGLIISAMFMAMLSSLSSVYNSASTLITMDLYQALWRPDATDVQLVRCGRAAGVLMTLLTFCWFPVLSNQNGLIFLFAQNIMAHLFPSLVVVFLLGILTVTVNTQGALAGVAVGFLVGTAQMVTVLSSDEGNCEDSFFSWECMHFNHFAIVLSMIVLGVTLGVSKLFPPPAPEQVAGRTIWNVSLEPLVDLSDAGDASPATTEDAGGYTPAAGVAASTAESGPATSAGSTSSMDRPPAAVLGRALEEACGALENGGATPAVPHGSGRAVAAAAIGGQPSGSRQHSSPPSPPPPPGTDPEQDMEDYMSSVNIGVAITLLLAMAINLHIWS